MSSTYIYRQPIFSNNMTISGYALYLNDKAYVETDEKSTALLIDDILLAEFDVLTDNTRGFVKFTKKFLIKEAPLLFPSKNTIIEIPGNEEIDDNIIESIIKIKSLGYLVAIDDFDIAAYQKYLPIIKYVDIAKVSFNLESKESQRLCINTFNGKPIFLAKNVETHDDFDKAKEIGYKLFQGTFYSKPITVSKREIGTLSNNILIILNELFRKEPDFNVVTSAFERDVELTYKALRMVNSAYYGVKYHTDSLRMALIQLGTKELIRWLNVMLVRGVQTPENSELIKTSVVRGKMLSLLAIITNNRSNESNYFISGMFSSIDVLLNDSMENVISKLPLGEDVSKTLLGEQTPIKDALDAVIEYEKGNWNNIEGYLDKIDIGQEEFISLYIDAIKWQKTL